MSPRYYNPNYLYEVTRRASGGAFLFDLNDKALMDAITGVLAEAQRRHSIGIFHFHMMSNHYHGLFHAPTPKQFARFLNFFHGMVASLVNQRLNRTGAVWSGKFRPMPVSPDHKSLIARMNYITGQATRAKMVQHPLQFAGPSAVDWLVSGTPLTGRYAGPLPALPALPAQGGETVDYEGNLPVLGPAIMAKGLRTVHISMLPCFSDLTWTEVHPLFAAMADEIAGATVAELVAGHLAGKPAVVNQEAACGAAEGAAEADDSGAAQSHDRRGPQPDPHDPTDECAGPSQLGAVPKVAAPAPWDPATGQRHTRPAPAKKGQRRRGALFILTYSAAARDAYEGDYKAFQAAYQAAMADLGRMAARAQLGRRARMVRFPDYALLPSCVGATALAEMMAALGRS